MMRRTRNVDDHAAAARTHVRDYFTAATYVAEKFAIDGIHEVGIGQLLKGSKLRCACVVDENVDGTECPKCCVNERATALQRRKICRKRYDRLSSERLDTRGRRFESRCCACADRDVDVLERER